ncbi:MAG: hypothetical protein WD276_04685 [Actinomycetota bacterium]
MGTDDQDGNEGVSFGFAALLVVATVAAIAGGVAGSVITRAVQKPEVTPSPVLPSPTPRPEISLDLGETATTSRGNKVTVESIKSGIELPNTPKGQTFSRARARYCVGDKDISVAVGIVARLFSVELADESESAVAPGVPKPDLLDQATNIIGRGRCGVGDVYFLHPEGVPVTNVVFKGYSIVKWELP